MKLKQLLKETKVWERKFGESLPTLEDTTKAYKLKLEQQFKAKSKETGRVVVYKSKDAMDKAIKGGKAEPLDKKTGDKPKGFGLFKKKDFGKDKTRGAAKGRPATTVVDRGDGKLTNVFGKGIESVDDLKQMISKIKDIHF